MSLGISVIIPTFNEAETISSLIIFLNSEIDKLKEIIVVDDNSPDRTWEKVELLSKADNRIRLLRRENRLGLVSALNDAMGMTRGDSVLWLDADFIGAKGILRSMVFALDSADIVIASRYVSSGDDLRKERLRVIASLVVNCFARFVLGTKTKDLTSGYCLARKGALNNNKFSGYYGDYFIRFIWQAEKSGLKIREIPYSALSRISGESKTASSLVNFISLGFKYLLTIFKIKFLRK